MQNITKNPFFRLAFRYLPGKSRKQCFPIFVSRIVEKLDKSDKMKKKT